MKQNKIRSKDKVVKTYWINCPICGQEIKGNSASNVEVNLKFHLDKHTKLKKEAQKMNSKKPEAAPL